MKSFFKEFKAFINRGNVTEMAVGIIMGTAFKAIIDSVVTDIFMPFVGILLGGVDLTSLSLQVEGATLKYGIFLQSIINFLVISFCLYVIVKGLNAMRKKKEVDKSEKKETGPSEIELLAEIRDLLKKEK